MIKKVYFLHLARLFVEFCKKIIFNNYINDHMLY